MNRRASVVILQGNDEDASRCREHLQSDFDILLSTADHRAALTKVDEAKPDLFLLSFYLQNTDRLWVLEEVKRISPNTGNVVVDYSCSQEVIDIATKAGADLYLPYSMGYPASKQMIDDCVKGTPSAEKRIIPHYASEAIEGIEKFNERKIDSILGRLFIGMGMSPNLKGFNYLRTGIKLAMVKPKLLDSVTKELYPMIAKMFVTTSSKVERAIRHALDVGWSKGNTSAVFSEMFGVEAFTTNERPTSSEFIALVADRLMLQDMLAD